MEDRLISLKAAIDILDKWLAVEGYSEGEINVMRAMKLELETLPSAQPEPCEDAVNRKDAIRWVKTECNPYGKPTLDFESGKKVIEYLERMPSVTPNQRWISYSERLPEVGKEVLVCYDFKGYRSVLVGSLYGDGKFHGYDDEYLTVEGRKHRKAVAWMPLPEPYRAEGEK